MSSSDYLRNGWIRPHERRAREVQQLLAIVARDLEQSQVPGLGPEWRFDIAYSAVLQAGVAALAACGFRPERSSKHLRTLESLVFTVGATEDELSFLDVCRRKRHRAVYEQAGSISSKEASELVAFAAGLERRLIAWLASHHADLLA
jgi:hypothetical protein